MAVLILLQFCPGALADEAAFKELVTLNKKILTEQLDLSVTSLDMQLASANYHKYRKWIDYGGQEASASGFLVSGIVGTDKIGHNIDTPLKVNKNSLVKALNAGMAGTIVGASASASQILMDGVDSIVRKKGNTRIVRKNFLKRLSGLDQMIETRKKLVATDPDLASSKLIASEGKLLDALRDMICTEFYKTYCYVTDAQVSQTVFYGLDVARNTTGAIGAGVLKRSLFKPDLTPAANTWFMVSGAITIGAPWVSSGAGKIWRKVAEKRLQKRLDLSGEPVVEHVLACRKELREAMKSEQNESIKNMYPVTEVTAALDESHGSLEKRVMAGLIQKEKYRRTAFQQKFASAAIGGQFLAFGIIGNASYQKYGKHLRLRKWNRCLTAANIITISATSLAIGATGAAALAGEYAEWKGRRSKDRVQDMLDSRIKDIESVKGEILKVQP